MGSFGEKVDLTAILQSILERYPLGVGLFREIIQNSDDAKATKQVFVLDHRTHSKNELIHENLGVLQGPSLLAYNDATFHEQDWDALRNISRSSKKTDPLKIGKYGIGIRSCYHLTDNLQILSGNSLVIFDPHHDLIDDGGKKWDLAEICDQYPDQLSPFRDFLGDAVPPSFHGTVIRLPLRTSSRASSISSKVPSPEEIRNLLLQFIKEELGIVMLFLSHISCVEIQEVDSKGRRPVATCVITRRSSDNHTGSDPVAGSTTRHLTCTVKIEQYSASGVCVQTNAQQWFLTHSSFFRERCVATLAERLGYGDEDDVMSNLDIEKLCPNEGSPVAIAIPLPVGSPSGSAAGRLFTYLPLPLNTGFPCHIHALFALTDSRDHLRNSMEKVLHKTRAKFLIEWNHVLFENFIPDAWVAMLENVIEHEEAGDIYQVWPPVQHPVSGGESAYWRKLLLRVLQVVIDRQSPIWPVIPGVTAKENALNLGVTRVRRVDYTALDSVLVAADDLDPALLGALADAGVIVTQPPAYIFVMLVESQENQNVLTPRAAHDAIVQGGRNISKLDSPSKERILRYLLSSGDISLLADLPWFPLVSGEFVSLHTNDDASNSNAVHTLLRREEAHLFRDYDLTAIALYQLSNTVADELFTRGGAVLNVAQLSCKKVVEYLWLAFEHHGLSFTIPTSSCVTEEMLKWLFQFWNWSVSWSSGDELLSSLRSATLLPTSEKYLWITQEGLFLENGIEDPVLREVLIQFGVSFLHPTFPRTARRYLEQHSLTRYPDRAADLLDTLRHQTGYSLSEDAAQSLRQHLSLCLSRSARLTDRQKFQLRSLPIFRLLVPNSASKEASSLVRLCSIPSRASIYCVAGAGTDLLPSIPGTVFLADCDSGRSLVEHIDLRAAVKLLSEFDIVQLATANLMNQSPDFQVALLERLASRPSLRAYEIIRTLKETPFVPILGDETIYRAPKDVVDPDSDIANLICPDEFVLPSTEGLSSRMVLALRTLGMMRRQLSTDFVQDRIAYIYDLGFSSPRRASQLSYSLLQLLQSTSFNCASLQISTDVMWLPMPEGLCDAQQCRDRQNYQLFDRVLPIIDINIESLRKVLGWDQPVSLSILKRQLEAVISESPDTDYLYPIVRELGSRIQELHPHFLLELRQVTLCRQWIPIAPDCIATSSEAVFSLTSDLTGFHQIPLELTSCPGVRKLLREMGCSIRPSNKALLHQLHGLKNESTPSPSGKAVNLLKAIQFEDLTDEESAQIVVPDLDGRLRSCQDLYQDDLGPRARYVELPSNRTKVHKQVAEDFKLREHLGIQSLSSLHLQRLDPDDEDMHEDLTIRIRNVLSSYSQEHSFNEFLANAVDANANEFDILLDEKHIDVTGLEFLSPQMHQLWSGPALVLHNDAEFTEQDFKGIREVGLGGKQSRPGTIGKYGLGALSMFHFTDCPMIISKQHVLILDPGNIYLPPDRDRHRNALRIPLSTLRRLYSGHVEVLHGLFGFSKNVDCYEGTLFRLPLRTKSLQACCRLSPDPLNISRVRRMLESYEEVAPQSLIFIRLNVVRAWERDSQGSCLQSWSVTTLREQIQQEHNYQCERLVVKRSPSRSSIQPHSQEWHVVSSTVSLETLLCPFQQLISSRRLKDIVIGLAGPLSMSPKFSGRFFSMLPLPTNASLPVHVNASFILADDRRSIRFDDNGQSIPDAKYNRWILVELIPPLYFYLLETWPFELKNHGIWPGTTEDPLSRAISDAFYTLLADTNRKVFHSIQGNRRQPRHSVVLGDEPDAVKNVLLVLRPLELIKVSHLISKKVLEAGVPGVTAAFVHDIIEQGRTQLRAAYSSTALSRETTVGLNDIEGLLFFLLASPSPQFKGLPLLPLADGSLGDVTTNERTIYWSSWSSHDKPWPLFPSIRFLHPDIQSNLVTALERDANVSQLTGPAIVDLIEEHLPGSKTRTRKTSPQEQIWIHAFWSRFNLFGITMEDIAGLALVPTSHVGQYVSIQHCHTEAVLAWPKTSEIPRSLYASLQKLGAVLLQEENLPEVLQQHLAPISLTLTRVLKFFKFASSNAIFGRHRDILLPLSEKEQDDFAMWTRQQLNLSARELSNETELISIVRQLQIWPAHCADSIELRSLSDQDLKVLPPDARYTDIGRFLTTAYYFAEVPSIVLELLNGVPMNIAELAARLDHNIRILQPLDVPSYQQLLSLILRYTWQSGVAPIRVPNSLLELVKPDTLYARSELLFQAAFLTRPQYFLHQEFAVYESSLHPLGLHHKPDFAAFKKCVEVLHEDDGPNKLERANQLYEWYQELPTQIGAQKGLWQQLAAYRFIPCDPTRRQYRDSSIRCDEYVLPLPDLVSPNEILRPEHEQIAWTQRAKFLIHPHSRLFLADPWLGVPSIVDVVNHLDKLVFNIIPNHRGHVEILEDLRGTYQWLNERSKEAEPLLFRRRTESLFLNIDDPSGPWQFVCASRLIFNSPDENERQSVRLFLMAFKDLLISAGALEVRQPVVPEIAISPAEEVLLRWRSSMNYQRRHQCLTDAVFVSADGEKFHVHRTFLATLNEYFRDLFCGSLRESGPASTENPMTVSLEETTKSVRCVLDFIYTGELEDSDQYDQSELIKILHLAHRWSIVDLQNEVQILLIRTMTPGTYKHLRDEAERLHAILLVEKCKEYERNNFQTFRQIEVQSD
ncbi:hypothetical protein AcV5_001825 [Taiwanofungus camphoratus]|nr:hypothetical protein AcV5_001825 [Antrodia cinnamomea]KAI0925324.1 hypothetical protein AcV7_005595 [Antrodia cinnamomea]